MKILIAIDDSECSEAALQSINQNHWTTDTEFIIVTIIEPIYQQYTMGEASYVEAITRAQLDYDEYCQQFINKKVVQLKNKLGSDKVIGKVLAGDVASSIIREAEDQHVDLIIVGSHGRRGFQKFLLGSVAQKIVNHAPCSIQIVKQKSGVEKMIKEKECVMFGV